MANACSHGAPLSRSDFSFLKKIAWMQRHGSSLLLNWGEDDGLWECSWITGGQRYVGHSKLIDRAMEKAIEAAGVEMEEVPR